MKKIILPIAVLLLLSLSSCVSTAAIYITEINFAGDEFVEIYSNESLNLTNSKIFDDLGSSKFNTLELFQNKNSSLILIMGSNFKENFDISKLNCTLYLTDKSQISNGGLKNTGENLFIQLNSSYNLSFISESSHSFNENESLNFLLNGGDYISNISPCLNNEPEIKEDFSISINVSNNIFCNDSFNINLDKKITEDKIQFTFETQAKNFEIEYWIEDLQKDIIKEKRITTNKNLKSFSPTGYTQIYNVTAILNNNNCTYYNSSLFTYYSIKTPKEIIREVEVEKEIKQSYFKIKNLLGLTKLQEDELEYEFYKGTDTSKSLINVYLNKEKIFSTNIPSQNKKESGKFKINLSTGINSILVIGLDREEEFLISNPDISPEIIFNNNFIIENEKQYFNISEMLIQENHLLFNIFSNIESLEGECYVYLNRSIVSTKVNLSNNINKILNVTLNNSKILDISDSVTNLLKLTCKYKKKENKSFLYDSKYFNHIFENNNIIFSQVDSSFFQVPKKEPEVFQNEIIYESKNIKNKNKSSIFFILSSVLVSLTLIVRNELS